MQSQHQHQNIVVSFKFLSITSAAAAPPDNGLSKSSCR